MKNLVYTFLVFFAVSSFISCSGTKEITVPCTEKGRSDAQFFRASSSAKSRDMASSKDKAMLSTKQILASLIGSTIKSVTDNYLAQNTNAANSNASQKFETITRELVNQQLRGVAVTCENTKKNKDGNYESFVSLEMPKSMIVKDLISKINEDPELKSNFDESKFKQMAEKELAK